MEENFYYYHLRQPELREALKDWWKALENHRGERARLKRCPDPVLASLEKGAFRLRQKLPYWNYQPEIIGTIASCLAHIKENEDSNTFAKQLAQSAKGSEEPRLSELRFIQLQKANNWQDFFTLLRRAIKLLGDEVNIYSLAEDIIGWGLEHSPPKKFFKSPHAQSLKYRWAQEYYTQLLHLEPKNNPKKKEA